MVEYRPVPDELIDEFRGIVQYAFAPAETPESYERVEDLPGPARVGARRGLFASAGNAETAAGETGESDAGGDLRCVCAHHWFTVALRGDDHPLVGLSAVATPPEHRRQGLVERLLVESLREYRERDQHLSALWPFEYGFYRRYGWARAGSYVRYNCPPEALAFAAEPTDGRGTFRELASDEYDELNRVLDAHNEGYALGMRRTEEWWQYRVFEGWDRDPAVYGWEQNGELRGYVVSLIEEGEGETELIARDLAFVDREAYLQLLRFLSYHDSQVERVRFRGFPERNPLLFDLAEDPRAIECELRPGAMVRIVDVPAALEALSYPPDAKGRLTIAVSDSLADWNDGTFAVEVADGVATCRQIGGRGAGSGDDSPDVTIDVDTLSQLYVGHSPVERAVRAGELSAGTDAVRELLGAMFPPQDVFLREEF
ncbi:GNAT family N-acetyltransferase [Halobacteriales archaeon QS_4_69_34]|nr:MAG: GNAT family N-acetyltransferase [Halobacteriales archaeon QS_4_69_34]